jgi:aryl-alcohol dehydrogenase-like predicted oxidoreductase
MSRVGGTVRLGGDVEVRRLGFGSYRICGRPDLDEVHYRWGEPDDPAAARELLRRVIDSGVNLIDTADVYGPELCENLIAEALYPYPEDLVIATKAGFDVSEPTRWRPAGRPERLKRCCDGSLRRLKLDRIDLYQLHWVDPKVPIEESIAALADLQAVGKIRHIGVCNVSVEELKRAQQVANIVSVQNRYNLQDRSSEKLLEACEREELVFFPFSPLATGRLAEPGGPADRVARSHDATPAQVALTWLLRRSPVTLPIPGTSSIAHFAENLEATELKLAEDEVDALSKVAREVPFAHPTGFND